MAETSFKMKFFCCMLKRSLVLIHISRAFVMPNSNPLMFLLQPRSLKTEDFGKIQQLVSGRGGPDFTPGFFKSTNAPRVREIACVS